MARSLPTPPQSGRVNALLQSPLAAARDPAAGRLRSWMWAPAGALLGKLRIASAVRRRSSRSKPKVGPVKSSPGYGDAACSARVLWKTVAVLLVHGPRASPWCSRGEAASPR